MKKAAVFLMILTLSVSSAACGNKEKDDNQADAKTEQSQNADNSKDNDKSDSPPPTASGGESFADETESQIPEGAKTQKCSTSDPESGWFRKGEHKHVFAYAVETACDKHGWILGYTVHPGNEHDSRTFPLLYEKIKDFKPDMMIMDAGYKIQPLFPYKRPMTKEGFFKKYEYAYDEYYDCYVCPGNQVLKYSTTNRDGYREYKSCGLFCSSCPYLHQCTESKDHVKVITRHVWEEYMEKAEDIRHTIGNKEIYQQRKETIERLFGTAKEQHGFRYTQYIGKARMEMEAGLTFACMNLKKLAKILEIRESKMKESRSFLRFLLKQRLFTEKWGCRTV